MPTSLEFQTMNAALAREHQMVAVYQKCIDTKLLSTASQSLAVKFQTQIKDQRDCWIYMLKQAGGSPVAALASYDLASIARGVGVSSLSSETDILTVMANLEDQATRAYFAAVPNFVVAAFLQKTVAIGANKANHTAALRVLLNQDPAPQAFVG